MRWPWQKKVDVAKDSRVAKGAEFTNWLARCRPATDLPPGQYASWWRSDEDARFTSSSTCQAMERTFRSLPGIESSVVALIARHCVSGAPTGRVLPLPPPASAVTVGVDSPVGPIALGLSQEKGVQWFFSPFVPREQREAVWTGFADLVEATRVVHEARGKVRPQEDPITPSQWWTYAHANMSKNEGDGGAYAAFGVVFHKFGPSLATVDALALQDGSRTFVEFPTRQMMKHHGSVLRERMEGQAALLAALNRA